MPSCLPEPIWIEFRALLDVERPPFDPGHPLGCRRRIPDQVLFEHVVAALVHGSGYEWIASPEWSDRAIRRRLKDWGVNIHGLFRCIRRRELVLRISKEYPLPDQIGK